MYVCMLCEVYVAIHVHIICTLRLLLFYIKHSNKASDRSIDVEEIPNQEHPRLHTRACAQIDTVKIVIVEHMLTLNVAHQTIEACFEAPADLEEIETRKRRGRGSIHKSSIFL